MLLSLLLVVIAPVCDASLWQHVYHGNRFMLSRDRLHVVKECTVVTGTLIAAHKEADGDWHIQMQLDQRYEPLLNDQNKNRQSGYLVVEPMCANVVKQPDTLTENVCKDFTQQLFNTKLLHRHVIVTGAYVKDMEHGWMEIHPVTSIVLGH